MAGIGKTRAQRILEAALKQPFIFSEMEIADESVQDVPPSVDEIDNNNCEEYQARKKCNNKDIVIISDRSNSSSDDEGSANEKVHSDEKDRSDEEDSTDDRNLTAENDSIRDEDRSDEKNRISDEIVCMKNFIVNMLEDIVVFITSEAYSKASTVKLRRDNKIRKDAGEMYVDRKGNFKAGKKMGAKCDGCKFQCNKMSEDDRKQIFKNFWALKNHDLQNQYILSLIDCKPVEKKGKSRKSVTNFFFLQLENSRHRVCKETFLKTLGIGKKVVSIALKNKSQSGTATVDQRGKKEPVNKLKPEVIQYINDHIDSFPKYESHYNRRDSKKRYLHPDLNISKMFEMYEEKCKQDKKRPVSYTTYYHIFKSKNLSFKSPYNDTCAVCDELKIKLRSKSLSEDERKVLEENRSEHLSKADAAYIAKDKDKILARESDGKIVVKAFDLQKVLETPHLTTGITYYKRQLSTYNLTVHNLTSNEAECYMWYECLGGRGSDEIASVIYRDIKNLSEDVQHLIYYSDNCSGQNHNFTLPIMYTLAIESKPNLKTIEHKFLVVGHTHMECDSDHARIKRAKPKDFEVFIPRDWYNMIKMLKEKGGHQPFFKVTEMNLEHFLDFKSLFSDKNSIYLKRQKLSNGDAVEWSKNRWLRVEKDKPTILQLSLSINEPNFRELDIIRKKHGKSKPQKLKPKNKNRIPISTKKYENLIEMFNVIPEEYHDFYLNLPHSGNVVDTHVDLELAFESD